MTARYTSPNKAHSVTKEGGGVYIGTVTSTTNGLFVEIPKVAPGQSFGPCVVAAGAFAITQTKQTVSTPSGTVQAVTNVSLSLNKPAVGSKVICMFLDNKMDEVIVVGSVSA